MPCRCLAVVLLIASANAKILRNNALMSKMVSKFHNDIEPKAEENSESVLQRMQSLLCKNFQSVPCEMIMEDVTLRKLIEQSIQQIKYKKHKLEKTTQSNSYFAFANSDLSRGDRNAHKQTKHKAKRKFKTKDTRTVLNRKKIRKFYPHKVKYKENSGNVRKDFGDYSDERLSMSVEVPDMTLTKRHQHVNYKVEPADPPVWRIDYMKHGEPSVNMFAFEDRLKDKIVKSNTNVVLRDGLDDRKDVMHPDVYIKKNFVRNNANIHSDMMD